MKYGFTFIGLILWGLSAHGQLLETEVNSRDTLKNLNMNFSKNTTDLIVERVLLDEVLAVNEHLRMAKYHIIQGQVNVARQHLQQLGRISQMQKGKLAPVVVRYNAVIEFLEGNWAKSLVHLNDSSLNPTPHYSKICVLKVLMKIATQERNELSSDWRRCKNENSQDMKERDQAWMDTIVKLADAPSEGTAIKAITRYNLKNIDNDTLKSVVKLAMYLNLESLIVDSIDELDYSVAQDDELRSLLGHVLFRQGKLARAWKFLEGLNEVNTNNILGNIWALRGNKQTAFVYLNLAYMNKPDSQNATERMLPITWVLKQWKKGRGLIDLQKINKGNTPELQALSAAFDIQMSNYESAHKTLFFLDRTIGADTILEVDQMSMYVGLKIKDKKAYLKHGQRACKAGDMTACWVLMAQLNWTDVGALLESSTPVASNTNLPRVLASSETDVEAFKEDEVYIDQRDIEELDEGLINLIKN